MKILIKDYLSQFFSAAHFQRLCISQFTLYCTFCILIDIPRTLYWARCIAIWYASARYIATLLHCMIYIKAQSAGQIRQGGKIGEMMKRWLWRNWPRRWDFKTRYFQSSNSAYYFCFLSIFNPVQLKDFNSAAEEDYNNYLAGHVVNSFTHATHQDGQVDREHVNTEFISLF